MKPLRPAKATVHANLRKRVSLGYFVASLEQVFKTSEIRHLVEKEKAAKR